MIGVLFVVFGAVFAAGAVGDSAALAGGSLLLITLVSLAIGLSYFPWFWSRGGQTPGLRVMRLRVVRDVDGGPIGGRQAILRLVGYYISMAVFYIGFAWILVDRRRRGWADLIGGTCVVEV